MIYGTRLQKGNKIYDIRIRLNDECNNGHQDFSITGDIYEYIKGRQKNNYEMFITIGGKNYIKQGGEAIGKKIAQDFPEFEIFHKLHLCDYNGVKLHAIANGFYHLKEGMKKETFMKAYNINSMQYEQIKDSLSKIDFYLRLRDIGAFNDWKKLALQGIEKLEELTGEKFVNTSTRSSLDAPSEAEIKGFLKAKEQGYYSKAALEYREKIKELEATIKEYRDFQDDISKKSRSLEVFNAVMEVGGLKAAKNHIYYNHSNTLSFNWRNSKEYEISEEEFNHIKENIKLANIKIVLGDDK